MALEESEPRIIDSGYYFGITSYSMLCYSGKISPSSRGLRLFVRSVKRRGSRGSRNDTETSPLSSSVSVSRVDRPSLMFLRRSLDVKCLSDSNCTFGGVYRRKDKELVTTLMDDNAIASAATVGGRRVRKIG